MAFSYARRGGVRSFNSAPSKKAFAYFGNLELFDPAEVGTSKWAPDPGEVGTSKRPPDPGAVGTVEWAPDPEAVGTFEWAPGPGGYLGA
jgi:hypothetical protein